MPSKKSYPFRAKQFDIQLKRLGEELAKAVRTSSPYPISRFFEILPLDPGNEGSAQRLIARGSLKNKEIGTGKDGSFESEISNDGAFIDTQFKDDLFGSIAIFIPASIKGTTRLSRDNLSINATSPDILITMYDLNPKYGDSQRFVFRSVTLSPRTVEFVLIEQGGSGNELHLVGDRTKAPNQALVGAVKSSPWLMSFLQNTTQDSICSTFQKHQQGGWRAVCTTSHTTPWHGQIRDMAESAQFDANQHNSENPGHHATIEEVK